MPTSLDGYRPPRYPADMKTVHFDCSVSHFFGTQIWPEIDAYQVVI